MYKIIKNMRYAFLCFIPILNACSPLTEKNNCKEINEEINIKLSPGEQISGVPLSTVFSIKFLACIKQDEAYATQTEFTSFINTMKPAYKKLILKYMPSRTIPQIMAIDEDQILEEKLNAIFENCLLQKYRKRYVWYSVKISLKHFE